jgi:hypothetical protein
MEALAWKVDSDFFWENDYLYYLIIIIQKCVPYSNKHDGIVNSWCQNAVSSSVEHVAGKEL